MQLLPMRVKKYQRRFITLIEIMIVMILIALITGVLAVNFRGSLDEGKVFKTKAGIEKLEAILNLAVAKDPSLIERIQDKEVWQSVVRKSPLVQNPNDVLKDGWGGDYEVDVDDDKRIHVKSDAYDQYLKK